MTKGAANQNQGRVKRVAQRVCVGCGEMKPKKDLIRVVRSPEGVVDLDPSPAGKKAGRGAYLCRNVECLTKAVKGKKLERALEHPISDEVYERLQQGMVTTG